MTYALGIDIGSARLSAAVHDDTGAAARILQLADNRPSCSAALFVADDGLVVGAEAEARGTEQPERLVRDYLARVGDDIPIAVGGFVVAAEDLVALVARWVVDRAEELEGAPSAITVTYPGTWGSYRTALVENALVGVGLGRARLIDTSAAAIVERPELEAVASGQVVAVYDLGGNFELALLQRSVDGDFVSIGDRCAEQCGGADFDAAVFAHVSSTLPLDESLELGRVRRDCIEAKEALSFDSEVTIPVELPSSHAEVRMVRSEFESLIDDIVRGTIEAMREAISSAGMGADDLAAVVLVGGSARVPLVAELLSEEFARPIVIGTEPGQSVALGAAMDASGNLPVRAEPAVPLFAALASVEHRPSVRQLALAAAAVVVTVVGLTLPHGNADARGVLVPTPGSRGLFWPTGRETALPTLVDDETATPVPGGDGENDFYAGPRVIGGSGSSGDGYTAPPTMYAVPNPAPSQPAAEGPLPNPDPEPDPQPNPDPQPEPGPQPDPQPDPQPEPDPLPAPVDATGPGAPLE